MIYRRIRSQIALQKDKIVSLEEELKTKQNPTARESIEKYINNERNTLNRLYVEAKINGIKISDSEK
ncbi:hypothetical protein [Enterococcus malodoratus]|uniref:Uncharacterized protein n=1 Tax=Enterococcus malodoratus ATCC 43197 TaxID=1158601 RepID=R2RXU4_9ENTE|nr:hypothetical protein [Enterococcus malodoratus]EOH80734.1 hypothetical protein UAI_00774 [Enterococcus malodoratus ATCC 43197]EOT69243.1 hypothetical protein I585_00705 [Enterococcus malodoratus ATCC 43197]OJG57235.1 hypothetical protein RV07_GL003594 [Enterococcus malodoratus]SPW68316.1 Uncharacterised protein [Enterococcus malodoratus]STC71403.1 Uncharacterised protein [Enterococcus malodoratus]